MLGWILVVVGQVLVVVELLVVVMVSVELLSIVLGAEDMDFVQLGMMEAFDLQDEDELLSLMGLLLVSDGSEDVFEEPEEVFVVLDLE